MRLMTNGLLCEEVMGLRKIHCPIATDSGGLSSKIDNSLDGGFPSDSHSSAFISILSDSEVSTALGLQGFSSLGSKTDPVLEIQYPMPWIILAHREVSVENAGISENLINWRRILKRVITYFVAEYRQNE